MNLRLYFSLLIFLTVSSATAQMKVVVMGSSTAYGSGASVYSKSWAGLTETYLNKNTSDGQDTIFYNIAWPAYDTYQEMPSGFIPPPGRPIPDNSYNVTKALSYNPDIVIISLPSNDVGNGYSVSETMSNFRTMFTTIFAAGAKCYITTTQPRNDYTFAQRTLLRALADSITNAFGAYSVNFYDCLVSNDGQLNIKEVFRAAPSNVHVNDIGHEVLFNQIKNSSIFPTTTLAVRITAFNALLQPSGSVLLKWTTEQQTDNGRLELQRSKDGLIFETFNERSAIGYGTSASFTELDRTPFAGNTFYRLKIVDGSSVTYSSIVKVFGKGASINVSAIYKTSTSTLTLDLNIQKNQLITLQIINATGIIYSNHKQFVNAQAGRINISVGHMASGQYFVRIITSDGDHTVVPFTK